MASNSDEEARTGRLIELNDFILTGVESACAFAVRFLSPAQCLSVCRAIAALSLELQPGRKRRGINQYRKILGPALQSMPAPNDFLHDLMATHVEYSMAIHRLGVQPDWRPDIVVTGAEQVEVLRTRGRVVFWILPFEFSVLLLRLVAHDRGWPFHHVSLWTHGPGLTRFGRAVFNRRVHRTEEQYGPRIVIPRQGAAAALEQVTRVLDDGGMVAFRGLGRAKRPVRYPFLAGRMDLAMGAPVSAMRNNAALVLVSARKLGAYRFELDFEPVALGPNDTPEELGQRLVSRMESEVLRSPALWPVLLDQYMPAPTSEPANPG